MDAFDNPFLLSGSSGNQLACFAFVPLFYNAASFPL